MARFFAVPAVLWLGVLAIVLAAWGPAAFVTVAALSILEVTLSFDNAVVNAQVLKRMSALWRRRFLTWGIWIAVVGVRLVLPILLVAATTWQSPFAIAHLAFFDGAAYGALLHSSRYAIEAFGGAFLLLLSLRFFFDAQKTVHWFRAAEWRMARWGELEAVEMAVVLWVLLAVSWFVPEAVQAMVLVAGLFAVLVSVAMENFMRFLARRETETSSGWGLFIYLNVLDTAFSLDGVVGAFAFTFSIPLIVLGLGVGAYFVRSLTIYLTEHRILETLMFVENGAYWAIFGLALCMLGSLLLEIPETVIGATGLTLLAASYWSSVRARAAK